MNFAIFIKTVLCERLDGTLDEMREKVGGGCKDDITSACDTRQENSILEFAIGFYSYVVVVV